MPSDITVFGATWCEDTHATIDHLNEFGVPFDFVDIDKDPRAAEYVKDMNGGKQVTPTVNIRGQILTEPDQDELGAALRTSGLMV